MSLSVRAQAQASNRRLLPDSMLRQALAKVSTYSISTSMVLINGCSFTAGAGLYNPLSSYSVDYCIQNSLPYNNIAIPGSSNDNIRSTTISELLDKPYKFVMINWTTPWRLVLGKLIPTMMPVTILPNFAYNGNFNDNSDDCIDLDKFWQNFYDSFYYHRSYFESVFLLQEFCQSRNIGYVFTNTNNFMQVPAWQKISHMLKNNDHPDTYVDQFTGAAKDNLVISYQRLYKNHTTTDIKNSFKRIVSYVDAIDWSRFVGIDLDPFFDWPNQKWPTELDNMHPGKEAHLHWRKILDQTPWLTEEISNL